MERYFQLLNGRGSDPMLPCMLAGARYLFFFATISLFLALASVFLYGLYFAFDAGIHFFFLADGNTSFIITFSDVIILLLIATLSLFIALGFSVLFLHQQVPLPAWLRMRNFGDFQGQIITLLITLFGFILIKYILFWGGRTDIVSLSIAIGLMVLALWYFRFQVK